MRNKIKNILREELLKEAAPEVRDLRTLAHKIFDGMVEQMGDEAQDEVKKLDMVLSTEKSLEKNVQSAEKFFKNRVLMTEADKQHLYNISLLNVGDEVKDFIYNYFFPKLRIAFVLSDEPHKEKGYFVPDKDTIVVSYPSITTHTELFLTCLSLLKSNYGEMDESYIKEEEQTMSRTLGIIKEKGYLDIFQKAIKENLFSKAAQDGPFFGHAINHTLRKITDKRTAMISSLLHELQHAYDHYRSEGKHLKVDPEKHEKTQSVFSGERTPDEGELKSLYQNYLKLPHEVWARFSQAVDHLENENAFAEDDFEGVRKKFEQLMDGYDVLGEKMKKRVLKGLYKYYDMKQEDEEQN